MQESLTLDLSIFFICFFRRKEEGLLLLGSSFSFSEFVFCFLFCLRSGVVLLFCSRPLFNSLTHFRNNNNTMYLNQESVNVPYMELLSSNNCQVSSSTPTTRRRDDDLLELIPSNSSLNLQSDFVHLQITSDTSQNFQSQALSLTLGNQMQPSYLSSFDIHGGNYIYDSELATNALNCSSKYLRPAQELLDEVVSVWKALKSSSKKSNSIVDETLNLPTKNSEKMSKLLTMLEELDGRYRQYHHQMQVLGSSFEGIAGFGSAKPYTTLALQTISRQFRCLRDSINNQVRVIQRSIGEEEEATSQGRLTRLRDIELQIRQQKAAHQFGMMRHSWRPQRGLPETSVSILRAWLFEHFLHPYPKDSEKIMLARQTGLTRGQVANWFINARVRLWKPMVEEMYTQEFCEDSKTNLHENADTEYLNVTDYGVTKQQNHYNHLIADNERLTNASPFDVSGTTYDLGELGDLMVKNRVSLALGLQHSEIGGSNNLPASSSSSGSRMPFEITDYIEDHHDSLNQQNRIIGISTQMLPDFT